MKIFKDLKVLVKKEKELTFKILQKLVIIEKDKLYNDLKYPSLHKYLVKELKYSDAEAYLKVSATRLMLKSESAAKKIEKGQLSLSNAALVNKHLKKNTSKVDKEKLVEVASSKSNRDFKKYIAKEFNQVHTETLVLDEGTLKKFDRLRKKYGKDLTSYELIQILLEKDLKAPIAAQCKHNAKVQNSRYIPVSVKAKVYTGKCSNCKTQYNLEYHHKIKHSHGGTNSADNIIQLCKSCNLREEIKLRQLGFFA